MGVSQQVFIFYACSSTSTLTYSRWYTSMLIFKMKDKSQWRGNVSQTVLAWWLVYMSSLSQKKMFTWVIFNMIRKCITFCGFSYNVHFTFQYYSYKKIIFLFTIRCSAYNILFFYKYWHFLLRYIHDIFTTILYQNLNGMLLLVLIWTYYWHYVLST